MFTRDELIAFLKEMAVHGAGEQGHMEMDDALLDYINDDEIRDAWNSVRDMWYA